MLQYETALLNQNIKYIAGVDEAGRGPLAGSLVVAAVILDLELLKEHRTDLINNDVKTRDFLGPWNQVKDSKKLTSKKREELYNLIIREALCYSIVEITSKQIDEQGIGIANTNAFYQVVKKLALQPQHILTDHFKIEQIAQNMQTNITKGDSLSISIAAASILAKVRRDNIMLQANSEYPSYGFDKHKGYGTKLHLDALKQYGACAIHRKSFSPIKLLLQ